MNRQISIPERSSSSPGTALDFERTTASGVVTVLSRRKVLKTAAGLAAVGVAGGSLLAEV